MEGTKQIIIKRNKFMVFKQIELICIRQTEVVEYDKKN